MSRFNRIFFYFLFLCFLSFSSSQIIKDINLGEAIQGTMELDESHEYFKLTIPENTNNKVLVLTTSQDSESNLPKDDDTLFSDPDFYVSKENKYPSSRLSSEWYSQRYGADIVTIPAGSVHGGDIFYIGMYCQFKCRYFLNSYVTDEITIQAGISYILNIKPNETGNLKLPINHEFEELKVIVYFRQRGKIRVFMSKDMPSTQNSFNVVPSWIYGYSIIVKKNSKDYCSKCDYHIFIKNEGKNTIYNLLIMPIFQMERFPLRTHLPLFDTMDKNSKRCYSFPISKDQKKKEKLIIQITMYSGKIDILFEGWEPNNDNMQNNIKDKIENIIDEQFFLFDKKNFDVYDNKKEEYKDKDSNFNFCIFSKAESSFIVTSYFLTNLEHFQQFRYVNILLPGNSMKGYLLKGQVFKYYLFGLNLDKAQYDIETNITVKLKNIAGNTKFYGYYCENENCIYKKKDLDELLDKNELIMPIEENIFSESTIKINKDNNVCLKKQKGLIPALNNENNDIKECMTVIILYCNETNDEGLCIYDIQLEIKDEPILMKPREMYYGVIPIKKFDTYEIVITDEKVYNLVIVLNTESGDAELKLMKERQIGSSIGWLSLNDDYLPDVIRITPPRIRAENLLGKFLVKVYSKTFSTYHLYYYTTYKKENYTEQKSASNIFNTEITMNIKIGEIINDYFPIDIRYKLYSFTILDKKENIKIFMNKVNIGFDIYVFKDISEFKILQVYEMLRNTNIDPISGYLWKSNQNYEINIKKDDPDYALNRNYYIIIAPNLQFNFTKLKERQEQRMNEDDPREFNYVEIVARKAAIKFYLGVAMEDTPLMISEGVPHSMTLNKDYNGQLYYYMHFNKKIDFTIGINVLFGEIDIYIDINKIDIEKIGSLNDEKNYDSDIGHYKLNSMQYYKNIKTYSDISLNTNYFKKYLSNDEDIAKIFFYIKRSKSYISIDSFKECQYTIIEKSSEKKEEILIPGQTRTSVIPLGKRQHFIIEEIQKRKSGNINVFFKNGYGNVYVRIPKVPEIGNIRFPDEGRYDFIGETIYSGKNIFIPKDVYDRINSNNTKLQILVTVVAETASHYSNSSSEVTFSINYSNEPKRINQNEPYDGYIKKGELQYFSFYFDSETENIYIGLSNMKGDADMYLNYGDILPTSKKYHWNSNQMNHEFIDINKNDTFFKKNDLSISGFYILLIVGYIDTSFTLFISNHKNIIFPLRNNKQATCFCENEDDKCLFRYTDVFMTQNKENGINYNEVIFASNYLYGNGIMYAKVVKDEEFHKTKNISKIFPDQENYDISNKESKQRNYVKIQIKEDKYTEDSNILLTFICSEKTKVDITSTSIRYFKTTDFIEENKENYFFLGSDPNSEELQSDITLFFYNYDKKKDLIYSIHAYTGDAQIIVYSNNSWWDINKQKIVYDYQEINKFDINSYDEQKSLNGYNPYYTDYHNSILIKEKEKYDNIIFKIIPKNKFSFYIQCNYDKNFMEIPIGKLKSYFAKNNEFYGYFDITEEYSDIELTISLEKNLKMSAELYVKINIIDTTNKIKKSNGLDNYVYSIPTDENYDYKMVTDNTLGTISLNMRNFPTLKEDEKKIKFVRGLFYIKINQKEFVPLPNEKEENINNNEDNKNNNEIKKSDDEKALLGILLTPGINNFKQVKANPYVYYFSNLTYDSTTKEKIPETKVWELKKDKIGHDIMIIEISSCSGQYSFKIQDHLITGVNSDVSVNYYDKNENGKHTIYVNNLKSNVYYLSIEARESDDICKLKNDRKAILNCGNDLSYMMYYYTDYEHSIKIPKINKFLTYTPYGNGKIKIILPEIIMRDINDNEKDINDFKFDVFATRKKEYFDKLGNVCFLSRFVPSENTVFYLENMKVSNKKALIISGLGYRNQYYIGILVQNIKTRELIAFDPIVIWSGGYLPFPLWQTILTNVIIIGLIIAIIIYIRKCRTVKVELKEIKGEALPKSEFEMPTAGMSEHIRYYGIGESY